MSSDSRIKWGLRLMGWLCIGLVFVLVLSLTGCGQPGPVAGPYTATIKSKYHEPHVYTNSDGAMVLKEERYYVMFDATGFTTAYRVLGQDDDTLAIFDAIKPGGVYCLDMANYNILRIINTGECED